MQIAQVSFLIGSTALSASMNAFAKGTGSSVLAGGALLIRVIIDSGI